MSTTQPSTTTTSRGVEPDASASGSVLTHRGGVRLVLGAPGTGKTTALVEHVRRRVDGGDSPDRCLVIGATRQSAARLRTSIGAGLGATHTEPLARTASSLAFAVLRLAAARAQEPMPRLISGAEQDVVLRELLAGHRESGTGPAWPDHLTPALRTAGFRAQLRDLLMRAVEHGLQRPDLERLAVVHERPEWACAGALLEEYDQVTALADPGSYDPAWICTAAADAVDDDEDLRRLVHERIGFIGVDDAQELTASAVRLLDAIRPPGSDVLLLGDPDATVLGFRGAVPGGFLELARRWAAQDTGDAVGPATPVPTSVLPVRHGISLAVGEVADRVAARVGVVGEAAHRHPDAGPGAGSATVSLVRSPAQEAALVARWLRRAHLMEDVPWDDMAVIARSGRQQDTVRRALASGGVPVQPDRSAVPLSSDPAVLPLLLALDVVTRGDQGLGWSVDGDEAVRLLTSPLGGLDPVGLRRLRRRLRARELAADGRRGADELLAAELTDPALRTGSAADLPTELHALLRVGRVLDAGRTAWRTSGDGGGEASSGRDGSATEGQIGGTAYDVLWALWSTSGLPTTWSEQALAGGALGARADRDLDAVVVLFAAAERHLERLPGSSARRFLDEVRGAEVAADTLAVGARREGTVEVLTPHAAAGRRWRRVAVVGVQDGIWPDLRLRDTLLGAEALVSALHGRPTSGQEAWRSAQAQVRADELRQFHVAITRAREQVLVTATSSTDEQPSALLDLVDPGFRDVPPVDVPAPMTLRGLVGELRRTAVRAHRDGELTTRDHAVDVLLRLDDAGIPGADPAGWWALREPSSDAPLRATGPVSVSPSKLQTYLDCELRWFLTSRGADTGDAFGAELGTLVHDIVATAPDAPLLSLQEELDRRWPDLGLPQGWVSERTRAQARGMLERYVRYVDESAAAGRAVVGVELDLAVDLRPAEGEAGREVRLTGAVDRLERDADGALVVADYKTGGTKPTAAEVERHAQLAAYQVAVEAGAFAEPGDDTGSRRSGGAHLVQLGSTGPVAQVQPPLNQASDPDWARRLILDAGQGMAGGQFDAQDLERRCRRCPARFACPLQPEGAQR